MIRLERREGERTDPPVVMWLASEDADARDQAMRFKTKGEAWRAAGVLRKWSVEEAL